MRFAIYFIKLTETESFKWEAKDYFRQIIVESDSELTADETFNPVLSSRKIE